jgi:transcriptional regulator with XRE-family HTH domain
LREQAGCTIDEAAAALECSASKISRLETGKGVPRTRDVRDLSDLYGVDDEAVRRRLLDWATEGQSEGWWNSFRDVAQGERIPDHLQRLLALEAGSSKILEFEPEVIPGLLQTPEYVAAISRLFDPSMSDLIRKRFVEFRAQRQKVYWSRANSSVLAVVIGELALLSEYVPRDVLRRQLDALRDAAMTRKDRLEVRILPIHARPREAIGGPFVVLRFDRDDDQDVVHLEGREGATYLENGDDVRRYELAFTELCAAGLSPAESVERIAELSSALEPRLPDDAQPRPERVL